MDEKDRRIRELEKTVEAMREIIEVAPDRMIAFYLACIDARLAKLVEIVSQEDSEEVLGLESPNQTAQKWVS